jgi:hypothetical protein
VLSSVTRYDLELSDSQDFVITHTASVRHHWGIRKLHSVCSFKLVYWGAAAKYAAKLTVLVSLHNTDLPDVLQWG